MARTKSPQSPAIGVSRLTGWLRPSFLVGLLVSACLGGDAPPVPVALGHPGRLGETVVLLHGLARTSRCMEPLARELVRSGYTVYSLRYPSRKKTVERIAEEDLAPLLEECRTGRPARIHFVAHSLGNIVIRQYLATHDLPEVGRVVMLGPPNQGSEVVDRLGSWWLFRWLNGPAGLQLGTGRNALPLRLPPPKAEVGVIAGTRSINWILSAIIPGPDDGKVAVARAKLPGMADFVEVPVSHPYLMRNPRTIRLALAFLQHGAFREPHARMP